MIIRDIQAYFRQKSQKNALKPIRTKKFTIDPKKNSFLKENASSAARLTEKEMDILIYLHDSHPKKIQRQDLLDHVWGYAHDVETHTLETHIYRLRQKIEDNPAAPEILMTDDEGYFLNF